MRFLRAVGFLLNAERGSLSAKAIDGKTEVGTESYEYNGILVCMVFPSVIINVPNAIGHVVCGNSLGV
jgi:hypothetical protein